MKLKIVKLHPAAVIPKRAHPSDIGYDLTAISIKKIFDNGVVLYGTGLAVQPEQGYYTEILPRSSASKTDMILANGVGIIDPHYNSELFIAVRHMEKPELKMEEDKHGYNILVEPFCKFQLVMRKAYQYELDLVESLEETDRGDGCFGSSDYLP